MNNFIQYFFWPNPGNVTYASPKVVAILILCVALIVGGMIFSSMRKRSKNASLKRISKSWTSAAVSFGLVGLVLVVARVEQIQFLAMRALWVVWLVALIAFVIIQFKVFRMRYYEVLPTTKKPDPRSAYLPSRKKRR